ncbi:hypothetical protein PENTCL1PPCAC_13021, partial [Pristionchus entomophagus]
PEALRKHKFTRLGIDGRFAYFNCQHEDGAGRILQVWRVDTLVPSSHTKILHIPYTTLSYIHSTMGRDEVGRALIYILLYTEEEAHLRVQLHEIRIESANKDPLHKVFNLGPPADLSHPIFNTPIHNATLGVGQRESRPGAPRTLFMYDGSIVQGDIPYWRILLDRDSWKFSIEEDTVPAVDPVRVGGHIPDDIPRMVSRFPVVIDGAKRRFLRFGLDQRLYVFTEDRGAEGDGEPTSRGEWIPYDERSDNDQNLVDICGSRQLRETYSSHGHRATAIESKYALFVNGDVCILRHRLDDRHNYYSRLVLDDARLEYCFVPCGGAEMGKELSVGRQAYTQVTDRIAVLAGLEEIAVVDLQPKRLAEIAFWTIQKRVCSRCPNTGALSDGCSSQQISEMIGYVGTQELV